MCAARGICLRPPPPMGTSFRSRLFCGCFALIAAIALAADAVSGYFQSGRIPVAIGFAALGAFAMTRIFAKAIDWRIQRLKVFAEHVLDASPVDTPLPEEGAATAALNQS